MYLTEQEVFSQQSTLELTYDYLIRRCEQIQTFFGKTRKFVFVGCGSSYMLAKSGQRIFAKEKATIADAVAGGDYIMNPGFYQNYFQDSIVVVISRSGKTSEILRSLEQLKAKTNCKILSLTMSQENSFRPYSDLSLTLEWSYDQSVCQTRSVSNFYLAISMLGCFYGKNEWELEILQKAIKEISGFQKSIRPVLKHFATQVWQKAVVLANGPFAGIGEEGALAFTEIAQIPGMCFRLLDYRHGPMVLNDEYTMNIVLLQTENEALQNGMLKDLKQRGGKIITVSSKEDTIDESQFNICIHEFAESLAAGLFLINVLQILAFEKAMVRKIDPDLPIGLEAYIILDESNS